MSFPDRIGQVWVALIGVERFPFVVIDRNARTWVVQNLTRVGPAEEIGTIKGTQFGVEEGIFAEFEREGPATEPRFYSNILRERIT